MPYMERRIWDRSANRPVATYALIVVCAAIWLYMAMDDGSAVYERLFGLLAPSRFDIWGGAYWGLFSAAFVHGDFWHIAFNMWWLRDFGTLLEPAMGRVRFLAFVAGAAAAGSASELIATGQTGIGFSGVVYAMFGYMLLARRVVPAYRTLVSQQTVLWLVGWLLLCMVLTATGTWNVANAAHVGGFAFGCCVAGVFQLRERVALYGAGLAALAAAAVLSVAYMPWSPAWRDRAFVDAYHQLEGAANAGDAHAQLALGSLKLSFGDHADGLYWMEESARQGNLEAMNALAWTRATSPDAETRNAAQAVSWAEKACAADTNAVASHLDTLAASYAEAGRWDEALDAQRRALATLTAGVSRVEREGYEQRLRQLERHEPIRDSPGPAEPGPAAE